MKTLIVLLLSSLTVFSQSIESTLSNQMQVLTKEAFKAGVLTGVAYEHLQVIPHSNNVSQTEYGHLVAEKAWEDFQDMQAQRHPVVQTVIQPGTPYYTPANATSNSNWGGVAFAMPTPATNGITSRSYAITNITIRWQYQEVRDQQKRYERELAAAKSFNQTNQDLRIGVMVTFPTMRFDHKLTTNDFELGYRSDGAVIWRIPPEACN